MPKDISLNDIFRDLQSIEPIILQYEQKYQLLSPYFYQLYQTGKLEERWDFIDWAALYEIKLRRLQQYKNKISEVLDKLPFENPLDNASLVEELKKVA